MANLINPADSALVVIIGVIALFLGIEILRYQLHLRTLAKIPIRIHINGSRGKSSVTRLIGAALRQTGRTTITKTTGTAPRFILPDGKELAVFRAGKPNIIEQLRVVNRAQALGAEILVTECMAVTPEYISTLEDKIIKSTIGVITNIREDHLDVMGPTMYDVTVNIARSFPSNGVVFTAEKKWLGLLDEEAKLRGSLLVSVQEESVSDAEMEGFSYVEHKENVAMALAVAERFDVSRSRALAAMYGAEPDPGVLRETSVKQGTGTLHFFNALAANDPDSTLLIWKMACARRKGKQIAILILRSDRVQRTEGFSRLLGAGLKADTYLLAGSSVAFVANSLKKKGVPESSIISLNEPNPAQVLEALLQSAASDSVAVAMGNIVGLGEAFAKCLEQHVQTVSEEHL